MDRLLCVYGFVGFNFRVLVGFFFTSTAWFCVFVPRQGVVRIVRVARCACFSGLDCSYRRNRFSTTVLTFRYSMRYFGYFTGAVLRFFVTSNLRRKLIVFICRGRCALTYLFVDTLGNTFGARKRKVFNELISV